MAREMELFLWVPYIDNFLTNHLVKELWKSVYICQSYYQTSSSFNGGHGSDMRFETTFMRPFHRRPHYMLHHVRRSGRLSVGPSVWPLYVTFT